MLTTMSLKSKYIELRESLDKFLALLSLPSPQPSAKPKAPPLIEREEQTICTSLVLTFLFPSSESPNKLVSFILFAYREL
ncbi:hypothetical protein CU097_013122 [Rhizopus azygosporus]|uniref:Uncharacterized protein n=1 Tax=Rhizopus azygosporus TaxID=86630 RepID=A0A367K756_RHIAZ|nr:hypothetical protein CU097_013122 [Rhizopus azygosporus]